MKECRWVPPDLVCRVALTEWAERIKASGARRVWVYFNNDRDGYAIKNARALLRRLITSKSLELCG
jgi:uncharacterized protein YecE (DUF72 family)